MPRAISGGGGLGGTGRSSFSASLPGGGGCGGRGRPSRPSGALTVPPVAAPADPASLSDLFSKGLDTSDFSVSRDDGTASRFKGYDRLTGRDVVIDGVTLQETELEFTEYDATGTVIGRKRGNEFVHPEWRIFLGGTGELDIGDGKWLPFDFSPVEFDFPGDAGFLSSDPKYDCEVLTATLPVWRASYEP